MDEYDKGKLKVLIKSILIQRHPVGLSAKQLSDIINTYEWGFRTTITSRLIGKFLLVELNKPCKNFMENIVCEKKRGGNNVYSIVLLK